MSYKIEFTLDENPSNKSFYFVMEKEIKRLATEILSTRAHSFIYSGGSKVKKKSSKQSLDSKHQKISRAIHTAMRACRKMGYRIVTEDVRQISVTKRTADNQEWSFDFPAPVIASNGKSSEISPLQAVLIYKKAVPVMLGPNNFYARVNTINKYLSYFCDGNWIRCFEYGLIGNEENSIALYEKTSPNYVQAYFLGKRIRKEILKHNEERKRAFP